MASTRRQSSAGPAEMDASASKLVGYWDANISPYFVYTSIWVLRFEFTGPRKARDHPLCCRKFLSPCTILDRNFLQTTETRENGKGVILISYMISNMIYDIIHDIQYDIWYHIWYHIWFARFALCRRLDLSEGTRGTRRTCPPRTSWKLFWRRRLPPKNGALLNLDKIRCTHLNLDKFRYI
jgi:hypothetical protein